MNSAEYYRRLGEIPYHCLKQQPTSWKKCISKILAEFGLAALSLYVCVKLYTRFYFSTFHLIGRVSNLFVYPVVCCGAFPVSVAECTDDGLEVFKCVDKEMIVCKTITFPHGLAAFGECAMTYDPKLKDIDVACTAKKMSVTIDGNQTTNFDWSQLFKGKTRIQTACGTSIYRGYVANMAVCKWFQKYLKNTEIKIVRRAKRIWQGRESRLDLGNIIVMNEESLLEYFKDICVDEESKLQKAADIIRPNIIISGCGPMEESQWDAIAIGNHVVCHVTGSDIRLLDDVHRAPDEGEDFRDSGESVYVTPSCLQFCGLTNSACLGLCTRVEKLGEIAVGDPVYALYRQSSSIRSYLLGIYKKWKKPESPKVIVIDKPMKSSTEFAEFRD